MTVWSGRQLTGERHRQMFKPTLDLLVGARWLRVLMEVMGHLQEGVCWCRSRGCWDGLMYCWFGYGGVGDGTRKAAADRTWKDGWLEDSTRDLMGTRQSTTDPTVTLGIR